MYKSLKTLPKALFLRTTVPYSFLDEAPPVALQKRHLCPPHCSQKDRLKVHLPSSFHMGTCAHNFFLGGQALASWATHQPGFPLHGLQSPVGQGLHPMASHAGPADLKPSLSGLPGALRCALQTSPSLANLDSSPFLSFSWPAPVPRTLVTLCCHQNEGDAEMEDTGWKGPEQLSNSRGKADKHWGGKLSLFTSFRFCLSYFSFQI